MSNPYRQMTELQMDDVIHNLKSTVKFKLQQLTAAETSRALKAAIRMQAND